MEGPERATTLPRTPLRSSPASPNPVTSQPAGSGQGSQTGTVADCRIEVRDAGDGGRVPYGGTSPWRGHRHALDQALGSWTGPKQRGQVGAALTTIHGASPGAATSRVFSLSSRNLGHMRCVGALILDADGRLLLVKRGRPPGEGLWSLPGGRVEAGESDPEALVREIREETGLDVTPGELAGSVSRPPYEIYDYYATPAGGLLRAGDDAADVRWVPLDELGRLPLTEGLLDFLGGLSGLPR
ncbi:hypothetical protein Aph01nite_56240 [Acrocarpospora phusangensis]|uniref:Nudix hydrolase domain-containing protein n=2 Tax=Acrocarpospora phusangensis TaxID=1070424 RepID=A0A919QDQ1_9ACTN|nr:hypothetical protein Aph01nite_56240 [Acrocarpospora phusangensis]